MYIVQNKLMNLWQSRRRKEKIIGALLIEQITLFTSPTQICEGQPRTIKWKETHVII